MKQVISNTTPIRYLAEIDADYLLPFLFSQVLIPNAVFAELTHPRSPQQVKDLISSNPDWLSG
jgi:predicted nucleic acid-binding protein